MRHDNQADDSEGEANNKVNRRSRLKRVGRIALIVFISLSVIGSLVFASYYFKETADRVKFLTESFLSVVIAVVVIVQAWIYNQQRQLMRLQLLNFAVSERAYMGFKDVRIVSLVEGNMLTLKAIQFNGGRTPAWRIRDALRVNLAKERPREISPTEIIAMATGLESFLVGGGTRKVSWTSPIRITADLLAQLQDGRIKLYIRAGQRYIDNAGIEQIYTVGSVYKPQSETFIVQYEHHREHG